MADVNKDQRPKGSNEVTPSSFASQFESSRLPITTALLRPVVYATGDIFRLIGVSNEQVKDRDGNIVPRASYKVQTLNSQGLTLGTMITIKIKGETSALNDEDNIALLEGKLVSVVAFDNVRHWQIGNSEGLTADAIRPLNISPANAIHQKPQGLIFQDNER